MESDRSDTPDEASSLKRQDKEGREQIFLRMVSFQEYSRSVCIKAHTVAFRVAHGSCDSGEVHSFAKGISGEVWCLSP